MALTFNCQIAVLDFKLGSDLKDVKLLVSTFIGMSYESKEKCSSLVPPRGIFIRLNELGMVSI